MHDENIVKYYFRIEYKDSSNNVKLLDVIASDAAKAIRLVEKYWEDGGLLGGTIHGLICKTKIDLW